MVKDYYRLGRVAKANVEVRGSDHATYASAGRGGIVVDVRVDRRLLSDRVRRRGLEVPDDILIQASAFGDRRPTLFAVKKFSPRRFHAAWENVNWTFSNDFGLDDIKSEPEDAWRPPLPVALQNSLMRQGADLESVPVEAGINHQVFERNRPQDE